MSIANIVEITKNFMEIKSMVLDFKDIKIEVDTVKV